MRDNDFAQFRVDETKVKKTSKIKQPLVTHGNVITFTMHACAKYRGADGGAMAPPDFGRSVNPISTRGVRLYPPNYHWHPRIFRSSDGPEVMRNLLPG